MIPKSIQTKAAAAVGKFPTANSLALKQARSRRYLEAHRDEINRRRKERRRLAKIAPPRGGASLVEVAMALRISLSEAFTLQTAVVRRLKGAVLLSDHEIYQYPIERWIQVAKIFTAEGLYVEATEIMVLVRNFSRLLWDDSATSYLKEVAQPEPGVVREEPEEPGDSIQSHEVGCPGVEPDE